MPLILAIESDRRQAARITAIARDRLNVELIVVETAERALEALAALAGRSPDLLLTPQLMSPKDETALNERLRELDAAGHNVQTLTIPVLGSSGRNLAKKEGLLGRFRRSKAEEPTSEEGCDPGVFAAQISEYLDRAAEERAALAERAEDEREYRAAHASPVAPVAPVGQVAVHTPYEPVQMFEPVSQELEPSIPVESVVTAAASPSPAVNIPLAATALESVPFLSESVLAALDPSPDQEAAPVRDAVEPASMFFDANLDPDTPPTRPPDVATMDLSSIVELDDVEVKDTEAAPEGLSYFDEHHAQSQAAAVAVPAEPLPIEAFDFEDSAPARVAQKRPADVPDAFAEFISFDELGVLDVPTVSLGEFDADARAAGPGGPGSSASAVSPVVTVAATRPREAIDRGAIDIDAFIGEFEVETPAAAVTPRMTPSSVLDSLELLDGPEISEMVELPQGSRERRERRAAAASARTSAALESFFEETEPDPDSVDPDGLWTPLPMAVQQLWPRPEGPTVKAAMLTPAFDAPPEPGVQFAPLPAERHTKKRKSQKPAQDEWGVFDPAQCGFAALLDKLNEVTDK